MRQLSPEEIATRRAFKEELTQYLKKRKEAKNETLHPEGQPRRSYERVDANCEKG